MGTSTPWEGPRGGAWSGARRRLNSWRPGPQDVDGRLEKVAAGYLDALHRTLRTDPSAFGLQESASHAGDRLVEVLGAFGVQAPRSAEEFTVRLAQDVGGASGTLPDAVIRRAAVASACELLKRRPEVAGSFEGDGAGRGWASDILCDLYQLFFAKLVAEFIRSVVTAHIKLALPLASVVDPAGKIPDWITEKLLEIVPSPCEQAEEANEMADAVTSAESVVELAQHPVTELLPAAARSLVPRAVRTVLGLIIDEGEAAA